MMKISEICEKVCKVVYVFADTLHTNGINNDRSLMFLMALLCNAKGECKVLIKVESELEYSGINKESFWNSIALIRDICGDQLNEVLPIVGDMVIDQYYSQGPWGEFKQPKELTDFVLSLIREKGCKVIYNPFAGLGSYALANFIDTYYGQEINFATYKIALMRLELNGFDFSNLTQEDSIGKWNDHGADCIVATPPFGLRVFPAEGDEVKATTAEEFLLEKFISSKANYGYFVVSRGICFKNNKSLLTLRKEICEKNMLETVINLPSGIFTSTGVATALIVLNKNRTNEEKVTFVDAEIFFKTKKNKQKALDTSLLLQAIKDDSLPTTFTASRQDIRDNDYSFDFVRYSTENLVAEYGQTVVALGDILTLSEGERCDFSGEFVNNVIESSNFANTFNHLSNDVNNYVYVDKPKYRFHGPHIVFNLQGKVYLHRGDTDFYIGSALRRLVFKVDETIVDKEYLALNFLLKDDIQRNYFGAGMARVNPNQLLKYKIVIDDIEEQHQIVKSIKRKHIESEKKRLGIRAAGGDLTHMLGMPKDKIGNLIDLLLSSDTISEDDRSMVQAIDDNFRYMLRLINTVGVDFASVQGSSHEFCISDMLKDYVKSLKNLKFSNNYLIEVEMVASNDVTIVCDIDLIRVLLDSAFRNAYTHGFEQRYSENNKVRLGCKVVDYEDRLYTCITIANNGNPMDPTFRTEDYATLGKKAGKMGNTGKGGYHIFAIAKKYDGFIRISSSKEWPFILDVLIPAEKWSSNEIIEEYGSKCL